MRRASLHASCSSFFAVLLCLTFLAIPSCAQTSDLEQHLRDQYRGKTFLLRGFYSGDRLHYGPTGLPDMAIVGDWTADGFIAVTDISLSGQRLVINAKRMFVIAPKQRGFRFVADTPKRMKKAPPVQIEAELPEGGTPAEQAEGTLSRILLTARDDFAALVPDYWKQCVGDGLRGTSANCTFTAQLLAVPGVTITRMGNPGTPAEPTTTAAGSSVFRVGKGISPPKVIRQEDPSFSDAARKAHFQGMTTLMLVVDASGIPQNVRVVFPIGCGLDAQAVRTVGMWRFNPSEKDGQPVPVEIAVEVEFHFY